MLTPNDIKEFISLLQVSPVDTSVNADNQGKQLD